MIIMRSVLHAHNLAVRIPEHWKENEAQDANDTQDLRYTSIKDGLVTIATKLTELPQQKIVHT